MLPQVLHSIEATERKNQIEASSTYYKAREGLLKENRKGSNSTPTKQSPPKYPIPCALMLELSSPPSPEISLKQ